MYKPVVSLAAPVATVATAALLPETGTNLTLTVALALAMGMATWAVTYFLMQRFGNQQ